MNIFNSLNSADDGNDLRLVANGAQLGKVVFNTCKDMIKKIDKLVKETEKHIAELDLELKVLQQEDNKIQKEYFTKFIEAKSELREVRQRLRKLADKTIKDTRVLELMINNLDNYEGSFIVKLVLLKMRKLLDTSEKTLIDARGKYSKAIMAFEILNSSIQKQNGYIRRIVNEKSADLGNSNLVREIVSAAEIGAAAGVGLNAVICIPLDIMGGMGLCSAIALANGFLWGSASLTAEAILYKKRAALLKFQTITGNMIKSGTAIDDAIGTAINGLSEEIDILDNWCNSVDNLADNIDTYPEEYLKKMKLIRDTFIMGLGDLRQSAQEFLSRGKLFEENIDIENRKEKSDIEKVLLSKKESDPLMTN